MEIGSAPNEKPWWTAKQAANYIGVTPGTLYAYLKLRKNRPPAFRLAGKLGGAWRFPREEFIKWANGAQK